MTVGARERSGRSAVAGTSRTSIAPSRYWLRADAAKGSHKISAQKFKFVGAMLGVGASVLVSDIDVIYVQDPFKSAGLSNQPIHPATPPR